MPPAPHEYHGIEAIRAFLYASFGHRAQRRAYLLPAAANTQPTFGSYVDDLAGSTASPAGLMVLTITGDRISAITRFYDDDLYPRFGLPESIPMSG